MSIVIVFRFVVFNASESLVTMTTAAARKAELPLHSDLVEVFQRHAAHVTRCMSFFLGDVQLPALARLRQLAVDVVRGDVRVVAVPGWRGRAGCGGCAVILCP